MSSIVKVEPLGVCPRVHPNWKGRYIICQKSLVRVTFESGKQSVVHDDGSFVPWTGEQQ